MSADPEYERDAAEHEHRGKRRKPTAHANAPHGHGERVLDGVAKAACLQPFEIKRLHRLNCVDRLAGQRARVGDAVATIRFERQDDGSASHSVVEQDGSLRIIDVPPPDAVAGSDGILPRLVAWALEYAPGRVATALRIAMGDDRPLTSDRTEGVSS